MPPLIDSEKKQQTIPWDVLRACGSSSTIKEFFPFLLGILQQAAVVPASSFSCSCWEIWSTATVIPFFCVVSFIHTSAGQATTNGSIAPHLPRELFYLFFYFLCALRNVVAFFQIKTSKEGEKESFDDIFIYRCEPLTWPKVWVAGQIFHVCCYLRDVMVTKPSCG